MHTRGVLHTSEGFSRKYLERCKKESPYSNQKKSNDETNKEVYTKLVELDTRLGRKASELLFGCLENTTRSDIIKVGGFLV